MIAATVGIAGLAQLTILVLRRGGNSAATPLRIAFDQEMRGFLARAIPGMIAGSGPQLLIVAGAIMASASPSAVSWLYFANRLIELPLGIVGAAMGAVLVPELTRALRLDDRNTMTHAESRGLELAVGLALPATLGLIVLSEPVVRILFEHGVFTATDTAATAQALVWLALGLPAHVLVKALSPAFFARDDTATPLLATLKGLAVAIVLAVVLGRLFGAPGIAASLAIGAWSTALALIRQRCCDIPLLDRCRGAPAAAAHHGGRAGDGRPAVGGGAGAWACARLELAWPRHSPADPDRRRNRDLRPFPAALRRHQLARSG